MRETERRPGAGWVPGERWGVTGEVGSGQILRASQVRVRNSCISPTVKENQLSNLARLRRTRKGDGELQTGGKPEKERERQTGRR